jgi:hypothetical protein
MINSASAFHDNTQFAMDYANVTDPLDPIFTGVTLVGDSVSWTMGPHDYVGGLDSLTNGTIHAGSELQMSPLIVTWDAGTEYYPGAGTARTPAAMRAYVGIGNDNLRDNGPNYRPFDFNLTEDGQQIYLNVISMMVGAKMTSAITVTSDATLDSLTATAGTMEPAFDPDVMEYTLSLPQGDTMVTLSAYPADLFGWTIGDTAITGITDTMDIEVHVIAENWNEMIYTVTIQPNIMGPDGVKEEIASAGDVKVYPNPATSRFTSRAVWRSTA